MSEPLELVNRFCDSRLTALEMDELMTWIKADAKNARRFAEETLLDCQLRDLFSSRASAEHVMSHLQLRGDSQSEANKILPPLPQARAWRSAMALAAASVLVIIATAIFWPSNTDQVVLAASLNARWNSAKFPSNNETIEPGTYKLDAGSVMFKFAGGTAVVVEGPASFRFGEDSQMVLDHGKAAVLCRTPESHGFTLKTPHAQIVDLGTEFGVSVDSERSITQLFEGTVEVSSLNGPAARALPEQLQPGQVVEVTSRGISEVDPVMTKIQFQRVRDFYVASQRQIFSKSPLLDDPSLLLWSDMQPVDPSETLFNFAKDTQSHLEYSGSVGSQISSDRYGRQTALAFEHPTDVISATLPGKFKQLTLAAWVRFDPGTVPEAERRGLLLSRWNKPGHVHWQIKRGGLRITIFKPGSSGDEDFDRSVAFLKDIEDGQWHLLVSTIDLEQRGVASHYLDGELIEESQIDKTLASLRLGRCEIGAWTKHDDDPRTLFGRIDDLLVWQRALTHAEVHQFYEGTR